MADTANPQDSGALTTAESAYFESGGEKTEGLSKPPPSETKTNQESVEELLPPPLDDVADNGPEDNLDLGDDGRPRNKGQWVRQGAFHAEREQRKALQAENARLAEERARFDERLRILQEAIREPEAPAVDADPEPDPEVDFIAHQKWVARQVKAEREARLQAEHQQRTMTAHQRAEADIIAAANNDATRFAQANPDFGDAYNHLLSSRAAMYQSMGYNNAEINRQMRADEIAVYSRARERGISAAELIYNLSKTVGYQRKAAAAPEEGDNANGADISAAIDKIERINRGQAASKTLSGAGGSPVAPLSAESIANMSNDDFNRFASKHPRELKRLMGGG